jgi:predicted Rossmann fold flavoprotein
MSAKKSKSMLPLVIVGGGPAGLFAAIAASEKNNDVILLNKNPEAGKKIASVPLEDFFFSEKLPAKKMAAGFGDKAEFAALIFKSFGYLELLKIFKKLNLPLEADALGRFKANGMAGEGLSQVLLKEAISRGIKYRKSSRVTDIQVDDNRVSGVIANNSIIPARAVVLATGSFSSPKFGATKDGYIIAQKLGHRVNKLKPALVDLITREKYGKELTGEVISDVKIAIYCDGKQTHSDIGTIKFTPTGVSGPAILNHSAEIIENLADNTVELRLDFMPDRPRESFEAWLIKEFMAHPQIHIEKFLGRYFEDNVIKAIALESRIKLDRSISHITTLERKSLIHSIKDFRLTIKAHKPFNNTRGVLGGVSTDDINPKTCESKIVKSLYFAGDVIDILGPYGGYNMQFAFSSGYVAGKAAAGELN